MNEFINPYNFVPFDLSNKMKKDKKEDYYKEVNELKSGWIELDIFAKTPLIIPDGAHPMYRDCKTGEEIVNPSDEKKKQCHKEYSFLKDENNRYYIPGSELRGMVRSVYEASTNSCVASIMHFKPISNRIPLFSSIQKRGLLQYDGEKWNLYKTKARRIKVKFDNGRMFAVEGGVEIRDENGKEVNKNVFIQYNYPVNRNKPYSVAYLSPDEVIYSYKEGDDYPYRNLKSVLERDGVPKNLKNPNKKPQEQLLNVLEKAKNDPKQLVPVYYFGVEREHDDGSTETLYYYSGSSVGRISQRRKWDEVLGEYKTCSGPKFCPACLLFGTIKENGLKSKIRFSDATLENQGKIETRKHCLQVLGGPRPSAYEFYYRKPDGARYWNADFYSTAELNDNKKGKANVNIVFHDLKQAMPRGRKMYWHSMVAKDASERSKLNTTMEAIFSKNPFKFKIYFDQVTQRQLDTLLWVLTFGENDCNGKYLHKIGHAKPLGYGSVKICVNSVNYRIIDWNKENVYKIEVEENIKPSHESTYVDLESESVKTLLVMMNSESTENMVVKYPHNGDAPIYDWFAKNRRNPKNMVELPYPLDKNITLKENDNVNQLNQYRTNSSSNTNDIVVSGIVTGHNSKGIFAFVKLDDGRKASFYDGGVYAEGNRVTLIYKGEHKGKDGKMYPDWKEKK